jgi:hypothetical protein
MRRQVRDEAGLGGGETPRLAFSVQAQAAPTQRPGAEYRAKLIAQRAPRSKQEQVGKLARC